MSVFIKTFKNAFSMTFVKSEIIRFLKVNKIPLDMSKSEKYTKNNNLKDFQCETNWFCLRGSLFLGC